MFVRRKMYKQLRGRLTMKGYQKAKEVEEEDMPDLYIFIGYMAFVLFGPSKTVSFQEPSTTTSVTECR